MIISLPSPRMWASAVTRISGIAAVLVILFTAACATVPDRDADPEGYAEFRERNDPLEPLNRGVFAFNEVIDLFILQPAAGFYSLLVPPPIQTGVDNALRNLNSPVIFINSLLQGELERAGTTVARFVINTVGGVGGLYDLAADMGLEHQSKDFGQTLAVWGVPEGPYLVLPLIGPSNPRDAVGRAVDTLVFDPITWWVRANPDDRQQWGFLRLGLTAVSQRAKSLEEIDDIRRTSLDPYATIRSLFQQYRRGQVGQGRGGTAPGGGPDFDDIYLDTPPPATDAPAR